MKAFFLKAIAALIFVILIDGAFFLFYDTENCIESVWTALAGLNIAYLSLFLIPLCAPKQSGEKILSDTLYLIGTIYFILEFIVGITFIFWEQESSVIPIIIQAVLFGIYIILLISNVLANDATRKSIALQDEDSDKIKTMLEEAAYTKNLVKSDAKTYKAASQCYDDIKASPLRSTTETLAIEKEISTALMLMKDYAMSGEFEQVISTSMQIRQLVARRNSKLKNIRHY